MPSRLAFGLNAVAALARAAAVVLRSLLQLPGAALGFDLRLMAIRRGWHLPVARSRSDDAH